MQLSFLRFSIVLCCCLISSVGVSAQNHPLNPMGSYRVSEAPASPTASHEGLYPIHAPNEIFQQVSESEPLGISLPQEAVSAQSSAAVYSSGAYPATQASLSTYLGERSLYAPSSIPAFPSPTAGRRAPVDSVWDWTVIPHDLIFQSFAGGPREPRLSSMIVHSDTFGWVWELEAGARVGVLRYGSRPGHRPEGWQLDVEGAAFPRLNIDDNMILDAVDFKVGVPITYGQGPWQWEFTWYHISAHVGDEFLLQNPTFNRLDYLRDAFTTALSYYATDDLRLYGEIEYAYNTNDGAEPWHFQFGVDYVPAQPNVSRYPTPFFAANAQLREEVNFGGGFNLFAGFQWRGASSNKVLRIGGQYYNGESFQFSFFDEHEELIGLGIMYEF